MNVRRARVVRGIELLRRRAFGISKAQLSDKQLIDLLAECAISRAGDLASLRAPYLLSPPFEGSRDLYYRPGLTPPAREFAEIRSAATVTCGEICTEEEIDVISLFCYLHEDGRVRKGEGWQRRRIDALRRTRKLWFSAPLGSLLREVNALLDRSAFDGPRGLICVTAAEMYKLAREARQDVDVDLGYAEEVGRVAIHLAAEQGDWTHFALAMLTVGRVRQEQGDFPVARRWYRRALKATVQHELRDLRWRPLNDLFSLAAESGHARAAHEMISATLEALGPDHEHLPRFAHDVAYYWAGCGAHDRARAVYEALLPRFTRPGDRLKVLGNLARSSGACGLRARFATLYSEVMELAARREAAEDAAHAYLALAVGASFLGLMDEVEAAASLAVQAAVARGELRVGREAEKVLRMHREGVRSAPSRTRIAARMEEESDATAERLVASLSS